MKQFYSHFKIYLIFLGVITILFILYVFYKPANKSLHITDKFDLYEIKKRGKLVAIIDKNSADYYIYKGRAQGFQLDLLQKFSEHLFLPLEVIIENNFTTALQLINSGKADIIASNHSIISDWRKHMAFSEPIFQTRQVLIQRKKNGLDSNYVSSVIDLAHKEIYIKKNSAYHKRLINLTEEIGDTIFINAEDDYSAEALIMQVSLGLINYTIAHEYLAKLNALYFPNIDYSLPISFEQNTAWIIRKNAPLFEDVLNTWIKKFKEERFFAATYYKYFESERQAKVFCSDFCSLNSNKLSIYDEAIKKYSKAINWDWRLLASLIFQESKFNNDTVSRRGAFGLMQLMPITAQKFDVDSASSPEDNIRAGTMYIKWLDKQLLNRVKNNNERIKFILAAYNVGLGHIYDAQALAKKHGKNPEKWDKNVDYYLLNKSNPIYLNDTLVRNGSIKGKETYAFVKKVMERFGHYKNLISE